MAAGVPQQRLVRSSRSNHSSSSSSCNSQPGDVRLILSGFMMIVILLGGGYFILTPGNSSSGSSSGSDGEEVPTLFTLDEECRARVSQKRILFTGAPGVGKGTYASRLSAAAGVPHLDAGSLLRAEVKKGTQTGRELEQLMLEAKIVPFPVTVQLIQEELSRLTATDNNAGDTKSDHHGRHQGFILDGFPRNVEQAELLDEYNRQEEAVGVVGGAGGGRSVTIDHVIHMRQPVEVVLEKLKGRRVCPKCGCSYNYADVDCCGGYKMPPMLPRVEGVCDQCGQDSMPFVTRVDDKPAVFLKRMSNHDAIQEPLLRYYASAHQEEGEKHTHQQKSVHSSRETPVLSSKLHHFDVKRDIKELWPTFAALICSL